MKYVRTCVPPRVRASISELARLLLHSVAPSSLGICEDNTHCSDSKFKISLEKYVCHYTAQHSPAQDGTGQDRTAPDHGSEHAEAVPPLDEFHGYVEALS